MTEIYEIIKNAASTIMSSLFVVRQSIHNTRHFQVLCNESRRIVSYGLEATSHRPPFSWANLPPEYKLVIF